MKVSFDLVLVQYSSGSKEVCMAPRYEVPIGSRVETDFGTGTVLEKAFCTTDDEIFFIFNTAHKIPRIQGVYKLLDYKEIDENDLSAE